MSRVIFFGMVALFPLAACGQSEPWVPQQGLLLKNVSGLRRGGIDRYDALERLFVRQGLADLPPPSSVRQVQFATANPGVSHQCHWLTIAAQESHHRISSASLRTWPNLRKFQGTTDNVYRLSLDIRHLRKSGPVTVQLDGAKVVMDPPPGTQRLWLVQHDGTWKSSAPPTAQHKGPHRYGSIKQELRNRFVLVYGTQGDQASHTWNLHQARLDQESLWYRGNGSVDVLADTAFDLAAFPDRTVVLYGNRETHAQWDHLLRDSPVQVAAQTVRLGDKTFSGDDLACMFVQPRRDSDRASVIGWSSTGVTGQRLLAKQTLFQPFVRYPDCVILRAPATGADHAMVEAAGYFGQDWSMHESEFVYGQE